MRSQTFWERTYRRNIAKMIGVNLRYVGDRAVAEDLAHDAILKAIETDRNREATVTSAVSRDG